MYKGTSQNSQGRLDRATYRDAQASAGRGHAMTADETEANFKLALYDLDEKLRRCEKHSPMRKAYAAQKQKLQAERTAYLFKKFGGSHSQNWDTIFLLFRQRVSDRFGEAAMQEILLEAKTAYAASVGLTFEQAFNITEAAVNA